MIEIQTSNKNVEVRSQMIIGMYTVVAIFARCLLLDGRNCPFKKFLKIFSP